MVAALRRDSLKFLCSYGGKIVPRHPDGKLRYLGGHTRVLSVPSSVSFSELILKMSELCGFSVSLRCQLPTEDLDALVSITSDEDLANLREEYDRLSSPKIRAFLSPPKPSSSPSSSSSASSSLSKSSSIRSSSSSSSSSPSISSYRSFTATCGCSGNFGSSRRYPVAPAMAYRFIRSVPAAVESPMNIPIHHCAYYYPQRSCGHVYLVHSGNY